MYCPFVRHQPLDGTGGSSCVCWQTVLLVAAPAWCSVCSGATHRHAASCMAPSAQQPVLWRDTRSLLISSLLSTQNALPSGLLSGCQPLGKQQGLLGVTSAQPLRCRYPASLQPSLCLFPTSFLHICVRMGCGGAAGRCMPSQCGACWLCCCKLRNIVELNAL